MNNTQSYFAKSDIGHRPDETRSILFMLNCYDVWSATPDRLCLTGQCTAGPAPQPHP